MRGESRQAISGVTVLALVVGIKDLARGSVDPYGLIVAAALSTPVIVWAVVASARAARAEREVTNRLLMLGGRSSRAQLEASLFDSSAAYSRNQRLREALMELVEKGCIVENGDELELKGTDGPV